MTRAVARSAMTLVVMRGVRHDHRRRAERAMITAAAERAMITAVAERTMTTAVARSAP